MKIPVNLIVSALPSIKGWIFSDGKFKPSRAVVLIVMAVLLGLSYHHLGKDGTESVIEMLDDVSDIVGYAE